MSHVVSDIGHGISNAVSTVGNVISHPSFSNVRNLVEQMGPMGPIGLVASGGAQNTLRQLGGAELLAAGALSGGEALGLFGGGTAGAGAGAGAGDLFGGYSAADMGIGDAAGGGGMFGGYSAADMGIADTMGGTGGAGAGGLGIPSSLYGPAASMAGRLLGGGGQPGAPGGGGGNPFMNFLTGQGGGPSLPSLGPGLAALQYARNQKPINTDQLQSVFDQSGANAPLFVQAAQHPLQQAQAGGYGDILQSQAQRGIRGSSFGDQSIANYMTDTNRGIADAGTNAAQAALGLQGNLAGQISNLNALSQQMKNNLYGRAFSSLGQGLQPTPGMGFGGGMPGGGAPGGGGGGMPSLGGAGGFLNNLGLSGVGNAFGNALGSVGRGIGNLFGSPGSTFWSGPASPIQGGFNDFTGMWG